jgi:hypothetical protein
VTEHDTLRGFDSFQDRARPLGKNLGKNAAFIPRSISMMDVVMVAIAFAFFAVSIAYVYACERL